MCNCAKLFQDFTEQCKVMLAGCKSKEDCIMVVDIYNALLDKLVAHHKIHIGEMSESYTVKQG